MVSSLLSTSHIITEEITLFRDVNDEKEITAYCEENLLNTHPVNALVPENGKDSSLQTDQLVFVQTYGNHSNA